MTALAETDVPTGERALQRLLDRVAAVRPEQAARARDELDSTLDALRRSVVGDLAWAASCLTPSRCPIEVAVTSARDELRTVVDVLAPEADRHGALDEADRLARQLGSRGLPAGQERLLRRHQHRLPLRFGAWLGSRHTARTSTRKLYAEVDAEPERTRMLVDALAGDARRVLAGIGPVRLIGVSLDDPASVEVYVRPPFTDGDMVRALMGRAGIPHLAEPLCAAMAGGRAEPSGRNHGVSLTYSDGRLTAVAGFTFAHHMYRHDHRVRGAVLGLARTQRWPSESLYEAASRPLARPRPSCRPVHTALSAVAVVDGSAIIHHVGMAPPPATDPLSCSDRAPASTS